MVQAVRTRSLQTSARAALVAAAAPSGGWPYYAGHLSRIEPTAWALLVLGPKPSGPQDAAVAARARAFLRTLQRPDGLLVEPATPGPNYGWNGLALLALHGDEDRAAIERLSAALLTVKGVRIEDAQPGVIGLDTMLQAWPWTDGTFSWVEPTAYCMLALKVRQVRSPAADARLREAEAVLVDRVCGPGGWNYGNSQVLSQDLRPYVPTTALALLALQDKQDHPAVVRSLTWLDAHALSEPSTMALALAAVALAVYGRPVEPVLARLHALQEQTRTLGNVHAVALAAYALSLPAHRAAALTVR
jgi:hypothetical protein